MAFTVCTSATARTLLARKVVLATGIQGGGAMAYAAVHRRYAAAQRYTPIPSEPIDYAAMAGKRIAILGGGASAFDNAATALKAGVARGACPYPPERAAARSTRSASWRRVGFIPPLSGARRCGQI